MQNIVSIVIVFLHKQNFKMNILRIITKCKKEAIILKNTGNYDCVPGQLGLINDVIKNPKKHYKHYQEHDDMFSYINYLIYKDYCIS